jgi:glutamate formiminotransferase / formiminotetrahydrofolate cyclodeaminase
MKAKRLHAEQLLECVPNFSEGRDPHVIQQITDAIASADGVRLLDTDPGKATHRTVVTFVGTPGAVVEGAFRGIAKAMELIDMRMHHGEHPRMGATDVCPLIPVANISMEEAVEWARKLGDRVGSKLGLPVYLYEAAATRPERRNLATIRTGEYEGLAQKLTDPQWAPDYGPATFLPRSGATVIGARDFLVAYNVNLNTTSVRRANSVAFDIREQGRIVREGDPVTGEILRDKDGNAQRTPGSCKAVKAIGWYIEEYGIAQVSMNLTDLNTTPLHIAFDACVESAARRGMRVTGSELVGLVPRKVLLDAGRYFLKKQKRSAGIPETQIIHIAVKSLGLDELTPFDPRKKIIEYLIEEQDTQPLAAQSLDTFAQSVAAETATPGGGSVAAYVGTLGAALGTMVANLTAQKPEWDSRWEEFSIWAETGQRLQAELLALVDADTNAFNAVMASFRMPKETDEERRLRSKAIQDATRGAIEVPLQVMHTAAQAFPLLHTMIREGNPNSATDAAVGALCTRAAIRGAGLNVLVNLSGLKDAAAVNAYREEVTKLLAHAERDEAQILNDLAASASA